MSEVKTSEGLGIMCPGCWRVVTVAETGLPITTAEDLRIVRGWVPDAVVRVNDEETVVSWLCRECGGEEE